MNVADVLQKIEAKGLENSKRELSLIETHENEIKSLFNKMKEYTQFCEDCVRIATDMRHFGLSVCSRLDLSGSFRFPDASYNSAIIISDGVCHDFGIILDYRDLSFLGIGCEGGGGCGTTLYLSTNGDIIHGASNVETYFHNGMFEYFYKELKFKMEQWLRKVEDYKKTFEKEIAKQIGE